MKETKNEDIMALSKTLPTVIESGAPNSTANKISVYSKNGLSGARQNKKLNPVLRIHFNVATYLNGVFFANDNKGSAIKAFCGIRWGFNV